MTIYLSPRKIIQITQHWHSSFNPRHSIKRQAHIYHTKRSIIDTSHLAISSRIHSHLLTLESRNRGARIRFARAPVAFTPPSFFPHSELRACDSLCALPLLYSPPRVPFENANCRTRMCMYVYLHLRSAFFRVRARSVQAE